MRWFLVLFVCCLVVCSSWSDKVAENYYKNFWIRGKEVPGWKERSGGEPLNFGQLPLQETPENISSVETQIANWELGKCLSALQILVRRDMENLKKNGVSEESFREDEALFGGMVQVGEEFSGVPENFWQTVLFAIYSVDGFRAKLRSRLETLFETREEVEQELKKAVCRYWWGGRVDEVAFRGRGYFFL